MNKLNSSKPLDKPQVLIGSVTDTVGVTSEVKVEREVGLESESNVDPEMDLEENKLKPKPIQKRRYFSIYGCLKYFFYTIFLILLVLMGTLFWVSYFESGLRFSLNQGQYWSGDQFKYEQVSGSVLSGFTLKGAELNLGDLDNKKYIKLNHISLKWNDNILKSLWQTQHIDIDSLIIKGILVDIKSEGSQKKKPLDFDDIQQLPLVRLNHIQLPVTLKINEFKVDDLELKINENVLIKNTAISVSLALRNAFVEISNIQFHGIIQQPNLSIPLDAIGYFTLDFKNEIIKLNLNTTQKDISFSDKVLNSNIKIDLNGGLNDLVLTINSSIAGDFKTKNDQDFTLKPLNLMLTLHAKEQQHVDLVFDAKSEASKANGHFEWNKQIPKLINGSLNINVPSFKEVHTNMGAGGMMKADVKISGQLPLPKIDAVVSVDNIMLESFRIKALRLNASLGKLYGNDAALNDYDVDLKLMIADVYQKRTLIWKGDVNLKGTLSEHLLNLGIKSPFGSSLMAMNAQFDLAAISPFWQAKITQFDLKPINIGLLRLDSPASIFVSKQTQRVDNLCLNQLPTSLCMQGQNVNGNAFGTFAIRSLGTNMIKAFLPKELGINTYLNAVLSGQFKSKDDFIGIADVQLVPGEIKYLFKGNKLSIPLKKTALKIEAKPSGVIGKLDLDWGNYLNVKGESALTDIYKTQKLSGKLSGNIPELKMFNVLVPNSKELAGKVHIESTLTGSLKKPSLGTSLELDQGKITMNAVNQDISNIFLKAQLVQGKPLINIKGGANAGTGKIDMNGVIDILKNTAEFKVKGDRVQVSNTEEVKIWASPDIRFKADMKGMDLSGNLVIPEVIIKMGKNSSESRPVVSKSSDVIIKKRDVTKSYDFLDKLKMNLHLILGDKVDVGNHLFSAKLSGAIRLTKALDAPIKGNGSLQVGRGKYEIYGQKLSIDRGRVMFSGGLLNNPGLNVQASREFNNSQEGGKVLVGVRVSGSLAKPKLTLFSTPSLPDTSIVSYLVLGRAPNGQSGGETLMLLNAVRQVAMNKVNQKTKTIAETLGLDEFGLSNDGAGNASLGLGKKITKDLYVGVGVSLMDQNSYLNVRYAFLKYLNFEGQLGSNESSMDILFSKERD